MNARSLLVLIVSISLLISACTPVATPIATSIPTNPTIAITLTPSSTPTPDSTQNIGQVVATVPVDFPSNAMAIGAGAIWLSLPDKGLVSRIDPTTNTVVTQIKVGDPTFDPNRPVPGGLAVIDNQVWASISTTSVGEGELVRIDPATNEVAEHMPMGDIEFPNGSLTFQPSSMVGDDDSLWVTDFAHSSVARVDVKTKQVAATITNVDHPALIALDNHALWIALHRKNSVARIDTNTNTVTATIPMPLEGLGPNTVCGWCISTVAVGGGSVWVDLGWGNGIARIDPTTNQVVAKMDIEEAQGFVYSDEFLWVTTHPENCNSGTGYLIKIDPTTNTFLGKIPLDCPGGIAASEDSLWIETVSNSNKFAIVRVQLSP
jgi:YVTN family beta-propeller protein